MATDLWFVCRVISETLKINISVVVSEMIEYALVMGTCTAQANPNGVFEYTES